MKKGIIESKLQALNHKKTLRFHMPGHKGRKSSGITPWEALDYTEVPGTDNLHDPKTIILAAQQKLATVYGSEEAAILVGGTTAGIQCAIMGVCQEGESLLIPVNCHRSVYGALALGRIKALYFEPEYDGVLGFAKSITPNQIKSLLKSHPQVRGLVMVNPTYYGTTSDVAAIAEILHRVGKILVVDEAHGAHLRFCPNLSQDAVSAGADVVVQSSHKMLGAFTQSALLHIQGPRVNRLRIKKLLAMLQSSSPSYPLMMSVENAVDRALEKGAEKFLEISKNWEYHQEKSRPEDSIVLYKPLSDTAYDKSKWLFWVKNNQGVAVEKTLLENFNIQCELSGKNHVLALTGMGTEIHELDKLMDAVAQLNRDFGKSPTPQVPKVLGGFRYIEQYSLWQALYGLETESLPLIQAAEKASGDFVIPYPPGIPALLPGSRITAPTIKRLMAMYKNGEAIMGMDEQGRVTVIKDNKDGRGL